MPDSGKFENRHIGLGEKETADMLEPLGVASVQALVDETIPTAIRLSEPLNLPAAMDEPGLLKHMKEMMGKNVLFQSYIGTGYYNCYTPSVIQRNILENPGWYTAYTPYQAEIAQGRLEALVNFQTAVVDLTGLPIANASLLDEATAAAEAMAMLFGSRKKNKRNADTFYVDSEVFPQVLAVLQTRAEPIGIKLEVAPLQQIDVADPALFGVYIQNPDDKGCVRDHTQLIASAHEQEVLVAMGTDLLALTLMKSPGEMGADVAVGSSQRFGVPLGYGGPHAAFFATREEFKRLIPGRIIGLSVDAQGRQAYRMALQTREQHIKRERATSNICTSQVLLAVMAGMYAVYHGKEGLTEIALRVHRYTRALAASLKAMGCQVAHEPYFDTLYVEIKNKDAQQKEALNAGINFRYFEDHIGISLDETTTIEDVNNIVSVFARALSIAPATVAIDDSIDGMGNMHRSADFLSDEVFRVYRTEHEMLRYIKRLENKDISLVHSMISLGSCTMKLNATTEMVPLSWPEVNSIHPFVPVSQVTGYQELIGNLENGLKEITGFSGVSLQPNSGAQGEFAGLMTIRAYHQGRGEGHRNIALIPASAHGTNPASAVMAGMKVVVIKSDEDGKIDIADLKNKSAVHADNLSALLVTYPSTHGVFEEGIIDICDTVHTHGGMVYMDGANMNAQTGLTSPAQIGADVCHLNLHKTFAIPHGGGGPGVGPICCNDQLLPYLPGHNLVDLKGGQAVSAAPWGSASILTISYAYIALLGAEGLKKASTIAILNANYLMHRLQSHYQVLYTGTLNRCAHELIIDCRMFKSLNITVEDISKRLIDYGFHAPTVSFPVAGTLMIEPTESESKAELDRFANAMIAIREEIREVEQGKVDKDNNVLKGAPHTSREVCANNWDRPYSREKAAYPLAYLYDHKFWPSVGRVNNAHGDRNLICTCAPIELYQEAEV